MGDDESEYVEKGEDDESLNVERTSAASHAIPRPNAYMGKPKDVHVFLDGGHAVGELFDPEKRFWICEW